MKSNLPIIEFDGVQVKPSKNGVYKCPFKCGNSSYREPTWKTEKGFRGHMAKCCRMRTILTMSIINNSIN
jgi:hypothetical protein